jgi:hypothetical protein
MRASIAGRIALLAGIVLHMAAPAQDVAKGGGVILAPEFSLGWVKDPNESDWILHRQASTSVAGWKRSGWWLEARTGFRLGPNSDLLLSGGWFFAQPASGVWHATPPSPVFSFDVSSYKWGSLDVLYRHRAMQDRLEALAGLRWDRKETSVHYSDSTDDDYRLNTYAPVLGLQYNQPAAGGLLSVRALGSPRVFGEMYYDFQDHHGFEEYGDFTLRKGYMLECRVQYAHPIRNRWQLGYYAQWATHHMESREVALSGSTMEPVSWTVTHQAWTLGVLASWNFRNPL